MKFLDKLTNILMPMEEVIEEELVEEKPVARKEEAAFSERKVVNGTNAFYTPAVSSRPQLTVHVTKTPELKIQVYVPSKFDQVMEIADDLKNNKAVIVNYERVTTEEQRRICDFINGACYVIDGAAKRISAAMVLYVPNGVSVADAVSKVFG